MYISTYRGAEYLMPSSYGPPKVCFCKYIVSVDNNISKIKKNKNVRLYRRSLPGKHTKNFTYHLVGR